MTTISKKDNKAETSALPESKKLEPSETIVIPESFDIREVQAIAKSVNKIDSNILFDFKDCSEIDSAAIQLVASTHKTLLAKSLSLNLFNLHPDVIQQMKLMGNLFSDSQLIAQLDERQAISAESHNDVQVSPQQDKGK